MKTATLFAGALLLATTPTPSPQPAAYARFCTGYQGLTPNEFTELQSKLEARDRAARARLHAEGIHFPQVLADDRVLAAVRQHQPGAADVEVLVQDAELQGTIPGVPTGIATDIVQVTSSRGVASLLAVSFPTDGTVAFRSATSSDLIGPYLFIRTMVAYALLNELLSDDTLVPRIGCVRAAEIHFSGDPGTMPEVDAALQAAPTRNPDVEHRVLLAYQTFVRPHYAGFDIITKRTIDALSNSPVVALVYRDVDTTLDTGVEVDVVRLQHGTVRSYVLAILTPSGDSVGFGSLCVVGDQRCADAYQWP